jgi:vacuolar-type H+-ATPase catalytic subunit A/Vma1
MALINDPNITAQIAALANTGTVDTNQIVSLINSVLPAGQQIATNTSGVTTGIYKRFGDFDKVNAKVWFLNSIFYSIRTINSTKWILLY